MSIGDDSMRKNNPANKSEPGIRSLSILFTFVIAIALALPTGLMTAGSRVESVSEPSASVGGTDDGIQTVTLQPNANAGKDTYITNDTLLANPDLNFGADTHLYAGSINTAEIRPLIEFSIPNTNANVKSATLSLFCSQSMGTSQNV